MISDRELMRISVAVSVVGLVALFAIVTFIKPERISVSGLKPGENVIIGGIVQDLSESKGNVFFTLFNDSAVRVVLFSQDAEFFEGDNVTVTGKVQFYRGEMEIIAKEVHQG